MITLVCFDPQQGTLRRYERGVKHALCSAPICTGFARFAPWEILPPAERIVSLTELGAFRLDRPLASDGARLSEDAA